MSSSLCCDGQLVLGMEPTLKCGYIPSEIALEKANFSFASSYKLNIASRLVGRSLCTLSLLSVVLHMYLSGLDNPRSFILCILTFMDL